jgi:uncharacterized protein (TIGR03067 family)
MNRTTGRWVLVALVLGVGVAHGSAPQGAEPLQGTWEGVEFKVNGQALPQDTLKKIRVVITADRLTFTGLDTPREFTFKVDPSKKPAAIDMTALNGPYKDKVGLGIYRLQQDTLTICIPNTPGANDQRPTEFASDNASNRILLTLKKLGKEK